jgi:small ligand-binding sensory domain FIST
MLFSASAASGNDIDTVLDKIILTTKNQMGNTIPDFTALFVTPHFASQLRYAVDRVRALTNTTLLIGCAAEGVIGPEGEFERVAAASILSASIPEYPVRPLYLNQQSLESCQSAQDWKTLLSLEHPQDTTILIFADPYTFPVHVFLEHINTHFPGTAIIGGLANGLDESGVNSLVLDDEIFNEGAVCLIIQQKQAVASLVSQGCRPIGTPLIVTQANRNTLQQIATKPPMQVINEIYDRSSKEEQKLIEAGIFIGRVIDEYKKDFAQGDFLIRNLLNADRASSAITVMDTIPIGTTVQFHIRDAKTSSEDLQSLLQSHSKKCNGALVFNCNGRGTRLYPDINHDLNLINQTLNHPPLAGFFCAGEIGPIGGSNFIHGHTASIALF